MSSRTRVLCTCAPVFTDSHCILTTYSSNNTLTVQHLNDSTLINFVGIHGRNVIYKFQTYIRIYYIININLFFTEGAGQLF